MGAVLRRRAAWCCAVARLVCRAMTATPSHPAPAADRDRAPRPCGNAGTRSSAPRSLASSTAGSFTRRARPPWVGVGGSLARRRRSTAATTARAVCVIADGLIVRPLPADRGDGCGAFAVARAVERDVPERVDGGLGMWVAHDRAPTLHRAVTTGDDFRANRRIHCRGPVSAMALLSCLPASPTLGPRLGRHLRQPPRADRLHGRA